MTFKQLFALILIMIAAFLSLPPDLSEAAGESAPDSNMRALVVPVLNTAFGRKDKFYGMNEDLSKNLQSFLTFSVHTLSDFNAIKVNRDTLYEKYPVSEIFVNDDDDLYDAVDFKVLDKAAQEYEADIVIIAEVTRAAIEVKGKIWYLDAAMKVMTYDIINDEISLEKNYTGEDSYTFSGQLGTLTLSGREIPHAELGDDPIKFGGLVTNFPFLNIAREFCMDLIQGDSEEVIEKEESTEERVVGEMTAEEQVEGEQVDGEVLEKEE